MATATTKKPLVGIIMGSDSDLPVMKEAAEFLDSFGVPNEVTIVSAHRTAKRMYDYAKSAKKRGIEVIIAGAGGAAHLPGMTASLTPLPVIGVPIKTKSLDGIDSLLSIAQMPPGVPVATVAINGAKNAGILACQILAAKHPAIAKRIEKFKQEMEGSVLEKAQSLEDMGIGKYLAKDRRLQQ
ncbi:5-(carboxyamino)imidazole ribonucleotide mutase [Candidatus Nitrososphaera evergladensis SR1]|jgi:5-(carboxyamino)imidazole ribonucleotide mutase|uniref:N5-carboxyaminoimidazole ribonucleotide mutase n=1 Tax=Candidatus Nitrososphaera evergladensis SR1 TaxID=1459636 RepID=A0A075MS20_9ARCH|nr:5-(carboxyamino)imidazole ribonucleotide mutase [Candidatus Nitrososphaera evergladensis]AIF83905.1 5-(carboxyamino)imidazole ribonucleotide mutase [Candidatus Nitrososphaera evergladensis SR1]